MAFIESIVLAKGSRGRTCRRFQEQQKEYKGMRERSGDLSTGDKALSSTQLAWPMAGTFGMLSDWHSILHVYSEAPLVRWSGK